MLLSLLRSERHLEFCLAFGLDKIWNVSVVHGNDYFHITSASSSGIYSECARFPNNRLITRAETSHSGVIGFGGERRASDRFAHHRNVN
ncbi:unnamed protein product, partial [Haemonchus placei]|uniref:Uncharacterized protein n=1 Tax=Haemonchus placei TaxID=6290 RepID=A0A0N4W092_HAEPC